MLSFSRPLKKSVSQILYFLKIDRSNVILLNYSIELFMYYYTVMLQLYFIRLDKYWCVFSSNYEFLKDILYKSLLLVLI